MNYGVLDLASSDPPLNADMILVKEVLQHLPLEMGLRMLQHAKHAGIKWLVVTHCLPPECVNKEIQAGGFFHGPDLTQHPFNFQNATETCEGVTRADLSLSVFDLQVWSGER